MEENRVSVPKQVMEVATKVATWATIAVLAFFTSTVISLDKSYGVLAESVKAGFATQVATLARIEKKQDENTRLIASHEVRISSIEVTRFTAEDSKAMTKALADAIQSMDTKIQDLWKTIAEMNKRIPDDVPPQWFLSEVRRIESELKDLQGLVDLLREKVGATIK